MGHVRLTVPVITTIEDPHKGEQAQTGEPGSRPATERQRVLGSQENKTTNKGARK